MKQGIWGECNATFMPVVVPPEGRIYVLQLNPIPAESGGGGLGQVSGVPGSEWSWSEAPGHLRETYGCEITNYGDGPVFNVAMTIKLAFRDVVIDPNLPNQKTSGAVTLSRDWPIEIPKIESGPEARFKFYIFNMSPKFAEATLGSQATVHRLGESVTENVPIVQPNTNHMWFVPRD